MFSTDPRTYTGAANLGLSFPMGGVDIVALMAFGGNRLLGDLAVGDKPAPAGAAEPAISASERKAARQTMSRMFD